MKPTPTRGGATWGMAWNKNSAAARGRREHASRAPDERSRTERMARFP